jgi:hypothetical protein
MPEITNTPESVSSIFEQFGIPASPSFKEKTRPAAWNRRSKAPYYTHEYGLAMKAVADKMLTSKNDQIFELEHFPSLRINSLYSRINQGIRFLLENMDTPDKKYATWRAVIIVRNEKDAIRLSFNPAFKDVKFNAREVTPKTDRSYKDKIDDFLESNDERILVIKDLALSTEEALTIINSLRQLEKINYEVTRESIRIVKLVT